MTEREYHCPACDHPTIRDEKADAYYCEHCDSWTEETCSDTECTFCKARPPKPSQGRLSGPASPTGSVAK